MLVRVFYDMHLREFLVDQDFCAYKTTREPIDRSSKLLPFYNPTSKLLPFSNPTSKLLHFSNPTSGIKIKRSVITGTV